MFPWSSAAHSISTVPCKSRLPCSKSLTTFNPAWVVPIRMPCATHMRENCCWLHRRLEADVTGLVHGTD